MNDLAFQCGIQREDARDPGVEEFARAIEAFHGIKPQTLDEAMAVPRAMAQAYENGYNAALANGPAWHDAPTVPGLWVDGINLRVLRFNDPDIGHIGKGRWLGPLPEDTK